MPPQRGTSRLSKALGQRAEQALQAGKAEPPKLKGGGDLPKDVNGVAQLIECKITEIAEGKQNAGKLMFYAAGIVKSPKEHEGARTQISEPLYDTPTRSRKTIEEHVNEVLDYLKRLGLEEQVAALDSLDDVEPLMDDLKALAPHFRFRTWAGNKLEIVEQNGKLFVTDGKTRHGPYRNEQALKVAFPYAGSEPLVNHTWGSVVAWEEAVDNSGGVEDETGENEPEDEVDEETGEELGSPDDFPDEEAPLPEPKKTKVGKPAPATAAGKKAPTTKAKAPPEPEPEPEDDDEEERILEEGSEEDLDALAELADPPTEDDEAQRQLEAIGVKVGIPLPKIKKADSWAAVVEMIREKQAIAMGVEEELGEEEAQEEVEPETNGTINLGDIFRYQPLDPKTKKKAVDPKTKAPVLYECEVTEVDEQNETVNLKNLDLPKMSYKKVRMDALVEVE